MKQLLMVFVLLLFYGLCISAQGLLFLNPSDQIIGRTGAIGKDGWSFFSNPSGLSTVNSTMAGIACYSGFHLKELSSRAALAVLPLRGITAGAGMVHFGYEHYSIQQYAIVTARDMAPWLKLGVRFNYFVRHQTGNETMGLFTLDAGLQITPHRHVILGFYAVNPALQKWYLHDWDQEQPSLVAVAVQYRLSSLFTLELGLVRQSPFHPEVSLGLDFSVHKQAVIRGGFVSQPLRMGLGTGFVWQNLIFNVGVNHHATLGFSSSFGIILHLRSLLSRKEAQA